MFKEVVNEWNYATAEELSTALSEALDLAKSEGHHASTVYPGNKRRMTLVRERLSDGSHVMNIYFFAGEPR